MVGLLWPHSICGQGRIVRGNLAPVSQRGRTSDEGGQNGKGRVEMTRGWRSSNGKGKRDR